MLITIIILGILGIFAIKKIAVAIYQKTGVNTLKKLNKFLWYVEGVTILLAIGSESTPILILPIIIAIALQYLLCMKAGVVPAIIMALVHGICGAMFGLLNVIVFFLNLYTGKGGSGLGGLFSIDESAYEVQKINNAAQEDYAQAQKRAEEIKREEQERADAYAQHQGFRDAEDAERTAGIKTGRPQD